MGEKSKKQEAGGIVGAAEGFAVGGPPGAVAGGIIGAIFGGSESDHNDVLRDTNYELADATTENARIYIDHIGVNDDAGNPGSVIDDVDMVHEL